MEEHGNSSQKPMSTPGEMLVRVSSKLNSVGQGDVHDDTIYLLVDDTSGYQNMVSTNNFGTSYSVLQSKSLTFLFRDKQLFTLLVILYLEFTN